MGVLFFCWRRFTRFSELLRLAPYNADDGQRIMPHCPALPWTGRCGYQAKFMFLVLF